MRRQWISTVALAIASTCFVAMGSAAPLVIDTFDTPGAPAVFDPPPSFGPGTLIANDAGSGILGQRDLAVGAPGLTFAVGDGIAIGGGLLDVASNGSATFATMLNYDSFGTLDLNGYSGVELVIMAYNNGSVTTQNVIELQTATGTLTSAPQTFPNIPPGPITFFIPFSAFSGPGSLGQVTAIQVFLNSNNSAGFDITLDSLQLRELPEPSSILVWGSMVGLGLLVRRRFRKRA